MTETLWVGLGGVLGAIARYWLNLAIVSRAGTLFPVGTLVINVSGSFVLGAVLGFLDTHAAPPVVRLLCATGFLGAYTTFSTFTVETMRLVEEGSLVLAIGNAAGSLVLGLTAAVLGLILGRAT
jgi:CrcB protein